MAKKARGEADGVNKGEQVEAYLREHPEATPKDVVAVFAEQGISVSGETVRLIRNRLNARPGRKKKKKVARRRKGAAAVNKTREVESYMAAHPDAMPKEVVNALAERGIHVSASLVGRVKYGTGGTPTGRKKAVRRKKGAVRARAAVRGTDVALLSADDLIDAKRFADQVGGTGQARRALELLEQLT